MFYNTPMANIFLKKDSNFELARQELLNKVQDENIKFFLQYNYLRIENIYDFLHSNEKIMALCGFRASGKNVTIQSALEFLPATVCKITLDCPQSIFADDIMLFVYNRLKAFCVEKQILLKKPVASDFLQMVSDCLNQIKEPIVIVLNSFEHCLEENNKEECINFLKFLMTFENIKIILSARKLSENDEQLKKLNLQKTIAKALEFEAMNKFFEINDFNFSKDAIETFYEHSRGYWGYAVIVINILKAFSLTLEDFLGEFETKNIEFDDFLVEKLLSLVSDNARNLLEFLSTLRINFPISEIISLNFASQEEVEYLIKKNLVTVFEDCVYVKDYIKEAVLKDTKTYTKYKIHKFLADFFENQLPLKPKDRAVELSRKTMREEVKYHNVFVKANSASDKPSHARLPKTVANMSYISYSRGLKNKIAPNMTEVMENVKFDEKKPIIEGSDGTIFELDSPEMINKLKSLDKKLLKDIQKTQKNNEQNQKNETRTTEEKTQNTETSLETAKKLEKEEDFIKANSIYENILEKIKDNKEQFEILLKIGKNYKKANRYTNAIEYLEKAFDIGEKLCDKETKTDILIDIANLYKETYKTVKAKNLYFEILSENKLSSIQRVKCYLGLSDIESTEHNSKNVKNYFEKIFQNLDEIKNYNIISEIYFKFGLFLDDENNEDKALNWYEKSIEISSENSPFISSCYSNIASIYEEKNKAEKAIKNYEQALLIDKKNNNLEGIYYCNLKLAKLFENKDKESAKNYYLAAIKYAKLINDNFYIANANLKYGDFCYKIGQNKNALKMYLIAKKCVSNDVYDDNFEKIESRLKDLRIKMGKENYLNTIRELKNNG